MSDRFRSTRNLKDPDTYKHTYIYSDAENNKYTNVGLKRLFDEEANKLIEIIADQ